METNEPYIPEFLKKFYDGSDYEGKFHVEGIARAYEDERATFMQTTFLHKFDFQRDWNKERGERTKLDPEEATAHIRDKYAEVARKLATEHGYVEGGQEQAPQAEQQTTAKKEQTAERQKPEGAKQEKTQQAAPDADRQKREAKRAQFLQNMNDVRTRQRPPVKTADKSMADEKNWNAVNAEGKRKLFLKNLESIRERRQEHRPGMQ